MVVVVMVVVIMTIMISHIRKSVLLIGSEYS